MKLFILGATLICAQLVGAGGAGGAGAVDDIVAVYTPPCERTVQKAMTSQEALNEFVAERATHILGVLNCNFRYPNPGELYDTSSVLWRTSTALNEIGRSVRTLEASGSIAPALALRALINGRGIIDCAIAISATRNLILLEILGDAIFNDIRSDVFTMSGTSDIGMKVTGGSLPTLPGTTGYIVNVPCYGKLHSEGLANGQNVFCIGTNEDGEPLYLGFGSFFREPKTNREIQQELYADLLQPIPETAHNRDIKIRLQKIYANREVWQRERDSFQQQSMTIIFDCITLNMFYSTRGMIMPPPRTIELTDNDLIESVRNTPSLAPIVEKILRMQGIA